MHPIGSLRRLYDFLSLGVVPLQGERVTSADHSLRESFSLHLSSSVEVEREVSREIPVPGGQVWGGVGVEREVSCEIPLPGGRCVCGGGGEVEREVSCEIPVPGGRCVCVRGGLERSQL